MLGYGDLACVFVGVEADFEVFDYVFEKTGLKAGEIYSEVDVTGLRTGEFHGEVGKPGLVLQTFYGPCLAEVESNLGVVVGFHSLEELGY